MKLKLLLIGAFVAIANLTACGGGTDPAPTVTVESPAALATTDTPPLGTGPAAVLGNVPKVSYTGYLYSSTKPGFKGAQFESGAGFSFVLGTSPVHGFDLGIIGMKAGGKRTVVIPAAQAFGANPPAGSGIPANSGLVYDIELISLEPGVPVESPAALVKTDTQVGTGADALAGKKVAIYYSGYLYTTTKADFKGTKFDSSTSGDGFSFTLGTTPLSVISGFDAGVTGMKVGGKRTVIIPAAQGYGANPPAGSGIPLNSGLVFDVELRSVQ